MAAWPVRCSTVIRPRLGPFVMQARLQSRAGRVRLPRAGGRRPGGRRSPCSPAARRCDAAARDRFVTAMPEAAPARGGRARLARPGRAGRAAVAARAAGARLTTGHGAVGGRAVPAGRAGGRAVPGAGVWSAARSSARRTARTSCRTGWPTGPRRCPRRPRAAAARDRAAAVGGAGERGARPARADPDPARLAAARAGRRAGGAAPSRCRPTLFVPTPPPVPTSEPPEPRRRRRPRRGRPAAAAPGRRRATTPRARSDARAPRAPIFSPAPSRRRGTHTIYVIYVVKPRAGRTSPVSRIPPTQKGKEAPTATRQRDPPPHLVPGMTGRLPGEHSLVTPRPGLVCRRTPYRARGPQFRERRVPRTGNRRR